MTQFIVISGIDGCGKTTIISQLRRRLEQRGFSTRYAWLRYNHLLVRPIHGLSRLIGLSRCYEIQGKRVWRHEFYRSHLFSSFYIVLTWLDVWLGRLRLASGLILRDVDFVVCDRWILDILVDLVADTRRRSLLRGKWCSRFKRILPLHVRQYLIVRESDSILFSRPDVTSDMNYSFRQRLYRTIKRRSDVLVVQNDGTVDAAVDGILCDLMFRSEGISNQGGALKPAKAEM